MCKCSLQWEPWELHARCTSEYIHIYYCIIPLLKLKCESAEANTTNELNGRMFFKKFFLRSCWTCEVSVPFSSACRGGSVLRPASVCCCHTERLMSRNSSLCYSLHFFRPVSSIRRGARRHIAMETADKDGEQGVCVCMRMCVCTEASLVWRCLHYESAHHRCLWVTFVYLHFKCMPFRGPLPLPSW